MGEGSRRIFLSMLLWNCPLQEWTILIMRATTEDYTIRSGTLIFVTGEGIIVQLLFLMIPDLCYA
jgi:hypothetical protein